ncbi:MAG: hypothetical protein NZM42_14550, partial [Gemmatales bacterium]|nr:hypothetical protein [Gemmatales bacterium]
HCISQFDHHLAVLGQKISQMAILGEFTSTQDVRRFFVDTVRGWTTGQSLPATTLTYAETIRPGVKAGLAVEAEAACAVLEYVPPEKPTPLPPDSGLGQALPRVAVKVGKRFGLAIMAGLVACFSVYLITLPFLSSWLANVLCNLSGIIAAVIVYALQSRWTKLAASRPPASKEHGAFLPLRGWPQAEQRLSTWFSSRLRHAPPSVREECERLRQRWKLTQECQ